jgi:hypothetical protein
MITMLAIGPKVCWLKPSQGSGFLRVVKISFLRRGSKAGDPMLYDFMACKISLEKYEQKYLARPNVSFS